MSHFRGAGIGAFCDERNSQGLMAVITDDFQGILVGILDLFFFFQNNFPHFGHFLTSIDIGTTPVFCLVFLVDLV